MKILGIILITGYFLAREREAAFNTPDVLKRLLWDWLLCMACALSAICAGFLAANSTTLQPVAILFAAALPAIMAHRRAICLLGGAFIAFWVLHLDESQMLLAFAASGAAVFFVSFFYAGIRGRMQRLIVPEPAKMGAGRLLVLLAVLIFLILIYEKTVQLY